VNFAAQPTSNNGRTEINKTFFNMHRSVSKRENLVKVDLSLLFTFDPRVPGRVGCAPFIYVWDNSKTCNLAVGVHHRIHDHRSGRLFQPASRVRQGGLAITAR
jgi:hypothetical protein